MYRGRGNKKNNVCSACRPICGSNNNKDNNKQHKQQLLWTTTTAAAAAAVVDIHKSELSPEQITPCQCHDLFPRSTEHIQRKIMSSKNVHTGAALMLLQDHHHYNLYYWLVMMVL